MGSFNTIMFDQSYHETAAALGSTRTQAVVDDAYWALSEFPRLIADHGEHVVVGQMNGGIVQIERLAQLLAR